MLEVFSALREQYRDLGEEALCSLAFPEKSSKLSNPPRSCNARSATDSLPRSTTDFLSVCAAGPAANVLIGVNMLRNWTMPGRRCWLPYPWIGCEPDDFSPTSTSYTSILFFWMEYDACTTRKLRAKAFCLLVQKFSIWLGKTH